MWFGAHKSVSQWDVANHRCSTCLKLSHLTRLSVQEVVSNNAADLIPRHRTSGGGSDCCKFYNLVLN